MFAVSPKRDCPHVYALDYAAFRKRRIDINGECEEEGCHHSGENWICCFCGRVMCSRYIAGHAAQHAEKNPDHCISVSFADCSCWCYKCDSYIDDPISVKFVREVQRAKFGPPAAAEAEAEFAAPSEPPARPIILDGAAAEMPDAAFSSQKETAIEVRDLPRSARVLFDNCSKCVIKVLTAVNVLQLQKCSDCTVYVDEPAAGIFVHGCINVTVRQMAPVQGCSLGVKDSVGVVVISGFDPFFTFYSSCDVVNSAVGIRTTAESTVIAEAGHTKTSFNREARAFQTVPVEEDK